MLKKIFVGALALTTATVSLSPPVASAENSKADELRQIINSNRY